VEECDDGNRSNTDACLNTCVDATCGDAFIRAGVEECDDGNRSNTDACLNTCVGASCGDAFVWTGEEACDDGNRINTDACLTTCEAASCGDGFVRTGVEQCDDGNVVNGDWCSRVCAKECPGGGRIWAENGNCYYAVDRDVSWAGARTNCLDDDSFLATITSRAENAIVTDVLESSDDGDFAWIGFNDMGTEGLWVWDTTGERAVYLNWAPGQPDNRGGSGGTNADCASTSILGDGIWFDWICSERYTFICEHHWE
jgi:cysteine-rich repeat protein